MLHGAVDRNLESARESLTMAGDAGAEGEAFEADVTRTEMLQAAIERAMARWPARAAARLMAVVVLPTPPFWFAITIIILCESRPARVRRAT